MHLGNNGGDTCDVFFFTYTVGPCSSNPCHICCFVRAMIVQALQPPSQNVSED